MRFLEIQSACQHLQLTIPTVCVIPVTMMETWLLFDEQAIRNAAGNPRGKVKLKLPPWNARIEGKAETKIALHDLLRTATEYSGRDLQRFHAHQYQYRVAEYIDDFTPLRKLPAFQELEKRLIAALCELTAHRDQFPKS